jgi:hypothetical protein
LQSPNTLHPLGRTFIDLRVEVKWEKERSWISGENCINANHVESDDEFKAKKKGSK